MAKDEDRIVPLYAVRVEDLRQWHIVEVTCGQCGRQGGVPLWLIRRHAGGQVRILSMKHKFRCAGCGHKGDDNDVRVRRAPRN